MRWFTQRFRKDEEKAKPVLVMSPLSMPGTVDLAAVDAQHVHPTTCETEAPVDPNLRRMKVRVMYGMTRCCNCADVLRLDEAHMLFEDHSTSHGLLCVQCCGRAAAAMGGVDAQLRMLPLMLPN